VHEPRWRPHGGHPFRRSRPAIRTHRHARCADPAQRLASELEKGVTPFFRSTSKLTPTCGLRGADRAPGNPGGGRHQVRTRTAQGQRVGMRSSCCIDEVKPSAQPAAATVMLNLESLGAERQLATARAGWFFISRTCREEPGMRKTSSPESRAKCPSRRCDGDPRVLLVIVLGHRQRHRHPPARAQD